MLAMPTAAQSWSLTSLGEKLIRIGAKVVSHVRYVTFQMAEVAMSRQVFADILSLIAQPTNAMKPMHKKKTALLSLRQPTRHRPHALADSQDRPAPRRPCTWQRSHRNS
jgi:hypothetical protein